MNAKRIMNLISGIKHTVSDEYIDWLSIANAGMLNKGNVYCFDYVIKNIPSDNPIIEIGSFCGLSTNVINYLLWKHRKGNKLFTSDKWMFEGAEEKKFVGESQLTHQEFRNYVKTSYINNISLFSKFNLPYTVEAFSDEFFELWKKEAKIEDVLHRPVTLGGSISFCYIDGNHSYEQSKKDFENADAYLDKNGFILFDDSAFYSPFGCRRLMKELVKNDRYELVIKNPNYLFKKVS
jgi:hypothetical protein